MLHEHTGGDKDQQQAGNEAVNTGGLGQSDTQDHGAGKVALALGIAADDLTGTGGAVTFADTRADTGDQSKTGADATTCQSDAFSQNFHKYFLLIMITCLFKWPPRYQPAACLMKRVVRVQKMNA